MRLRYLTIITSSTVNGPPSPKGKVERTISDSRGRLSLQRLMVLDGDACPYRG